MQSNSAIDESANHLKKRSLLVNTLRYCKSIKEAEGIAGFYKGFTVTVSVTLCDICRDPL